MRKKTEKEMTHEETKRATIFLFIILFISLALFVCDYIIVKGNGKKDVEFISQTASGYCLQGETETGKKARKGIAAANPRWLGLTAAVYENDHGQAGEFLGYYEIEDYNRGRGVNLGKEIKLWMETPDECLAFGKKKVLIVLIKGVG